MILHGSALQYDGVGTTKKLVCDRCGIELTEKYDVEMALEGRKAWEAALRAKGVEPRGIIPCENYIRCGGEMELINDSRVVRLSQWLMKPFSR